MLCRRALIWFGHNLNELKLKVATKEGGNYYLHCALLEVWLLVSLTCKLTQPTTKSMFVASLRFLHKNLILTKLLWKIPSTMPIKDFFLRTLAFSPLFQAGQHVALVKSPRLIMRMNMQHQLLMKVILYFIQMTGEYIYISCRSSEECKDSRFFSREG